MDVVFLVRGGRVGQEGTKRLNEMMVVVYSVDASGVECRIRIKYDDRFIFIYVYILFLIYNIYK